MFWVAMSCSRMATPPLYVDKSLSRLLSADSTKHDETGTTNQWSYALEVIGVTRDSEFGEEGGLKPQAF